MAYSLSAIPGYNEALAQKDALKAQIDTLLEQRDAAAREFGGIASPQAQQYQQQASALFPQYQDASNRLGEIIASPSPDLASPAVTTGQSQSTPANNAREDGPTQAPTQGGVGAGTSSNAAQSRGPDNNPGPNTATTQQALAVFATSTNQLIVTQPNQLDQYASYTYGISWYVLTPQQYNASVNEQRANLAGWQLLMQSGGAPIKGRSPAFPLDYYMDDLEIDSNVMGGQNMANTATRIKFRVTEPNGITLIENLFKAVQSVYANAQQPNATTGGAAKQPTTTKTTNYLQAQYCLVIQFYGYDKDGKLIAPAKGSYSTTSGSAAGVGNQQAVITKYYPFTLDTIDFRVANRAVEYDITGVPIPQWYASSTDRGTVPHDYAMTGQTVEQLLTGSPVTTAANTTSPGERKTTPVPTPSVPVADPYELNDTGFATNAGGAAFGNPLIGRRR
jgi:hypothetical protein